MTATPAITMPALDGAQATHAQRVLAALRARIEARAGWIGFDEYLELVLYAPGLGYYSAGAAKFGADGDFVTAPELSPLFGACIARACAPFLAGGGDILELGAGSGALAEALLLRLAELDALPARYGILEVSADLRARQCARLEALPPALRARLHWLDALPPRPMRGLVLANEVADALPFRCFEVTARGFAERGVALDGAGLPAWSARAADEALRGELERLSASLPAPLAPGYRGEVCLRAGPWIASLAEVLEAGAILQFDYGLGRNELYHAQREAGTLRCHYRHRAHDDPFWHPGLQDITAWVDFTRLAEAGAAAGLGVAGYCTQAAFLLGAGLEAEFARAGDALAQARRASEARQLLLPGEMGETFKAMMLTRGPVDEGAVRAVFSVQDLRRLL
ncbi:MAG TPA: SAM-dependent methyltransferase [Steroidobacteraceae bacterium]|nr:SAM-dependent methyltransferase [Steroidobacteraceae bacterium]